MLGSFAATSPTSPMCRCARSGNLVAALSSTGSKPQFVALRCTRRDKGASMESPGSIAGDTLRDSDARPASRLRLCNRCTAVSLISSTIRPGRASQIASRWASASSVTAARRAARCGRDTTTATTIAGSLCRSSSCNRRRPCKLATAWIRSVSAGPCSVREVSCVSSARAGPPLSSCGVPCTRGAPGPRCRARSARRMLYTLPATCSAASSNSGPRTLWHPAVLRLSRCGRQMMSSAATASLT
mmetsp:Transcript_20504/g.61727  ORF Transcript_20504/g.61727 Transcript_20504/m.61727 type:complete len:243 (+) Transcript_20504:2093-2821(+)